MKDEDRPGRGPTTRPMLLIMVAVLALLAAAFLYWALSGDPVSGPAPPADASDVPVIGNG